MKVTTPEINWHNRGDPVYSVDVCPPRSGIPDGSYLLATCATDCFVRLWTASRSVSEDGAAETHLSFRATLSSHSKAVNVVRFSPDGSVLASAGDDSIVFLWRRCKERPSMVREEEEFNEEFWTVFKKLRGHLDDIYDLAWSANGINIVTGSIDNSAIVWNAKTGEKLAILREHKGLVQGVAWDPRGQHLATLATDRCLRLFAVDKKYRCTATVFRVSRDDDDPTTVTTDSSNKENANKKSHVRLYHDDTMKSFFRRPSFSPDGQLLVTPAGLWSDDDESKPLNAAFVYNLRGRQPVVRLPLHDKAAIAVRFCPRLFTLRTTKHGCPAEKMIQLPYRMVLAVATEDAVLIFDTQQTLPLAAVAGIHYHQLSDLSWSADGRLLIVSSTDGYCSVVSFEDGELGVPYEDADASTPEPGVTAAEEEVQAPPRKASSRSAKTRALALNSLEIATEMEAKEKRQAKVEATTDDKVGEASERGAEPMTVIKERASEKSRIPLTSSSLPSRTSRRVALVTLTNSEPTEASEEKSDERAKERRLDASSSSSQSTNEKLSSVSEKVGQPRRVQLVSLPLKPINNSEEPMDT